MSAALYTRHDPAPVDPARVRTPADGGRAFVVDVGPCSRCGGAKVIRDPRYMQYNVGGIAGACFKCAAVGTESHVRKLYTAEEIARLNATRAKRDTTRAAKKADADAAATAAADVRRDAFMQQHGGLMMLAAPYLERSDFLKDVLAKGVKYASLSDGQVDAIRRTVARFTDEDARRAASRYVGTVGERIEKAVTVDRVASFKRPNMGRGFGDETVWIVTSFDAAGNCYVTKSPAFFAVAGETFTLRGTVKEHSEFRGMKQTVLQRAKKIESIHKPKEST